MSSNVSKTLFRLQREIFAACKYKFEIEVCLEDEDYI